MESPFLLLSVREGHEELMKAEVAMRFLGAKFAFSRPGFLSFKAGKAIETSGGGSSWTYDSAKDLIFPLRSALFVGKFTFDPANDGVKTTRVAGMEALPKCVHLHALDLTGDGQGPMPAPPADWSK